MGISIICKYNTQMPPYFAHIIEHFLGGRPSEFGQFASLCYLLNSELISSVLY